MRYEAPDTAMIEAEARRPVASPPPPTLSLLSFSIGLALLVAVFLFLNPIWEAADMGAWNQNIWWSYVPIPLVVGVLLALEHKLCRASLLLETMKMVFVKFTLTFLIAQVVWALGGVPGTGLPEAGPVAVDIDPERYEVRPAPQPSVIPAASTGRIAGRVTDATGEALAGTLVWIGGGLEEHVFATPTQAALLENSGAGFTPPITIVQTFQPLVLRNLDEQLHTAVLIEPSGQRLLNYPVIPHGERTLMFDRQIGLVELHCTGHGAQEPGVLLLVLSSPFATRTGPDGSFEFADVPAGDLQVLAHDGQHTLQLDLALSPGEAARADLAPGAAR